MAAAVTGLSPVIITVLMPMRRSSAKRSLMSGFTTSFRWMTPSSRSPSARPSGVPPERAMRSTAARNAGGSTNSRPVASPANLRMASTAPLRSLRAPISMPDSRVVAENSMKPLRGGASGMADPVLLLGQRDDRAALGRLVGKAGEQGRLGRLMLATPGTGMTSVAMRLPKVMVPVLSSSSVSTSPAASTARPDMASTLKLQQPVHAGDADGRQQAADGGRNERDEQRDQHGDGNHRSPSRRRGPSSVTTATRKTMVMPASRMFSAISLGVFCRSAPSTSAIMRSRKDEPGADVMRTTIQSEMHGGAAGDGRAVAAGLADDGRGFAGDRGLVDRGDALDDVAVAGDQVAGLDEHDVARPQVERRDASRYAVRLSGSARRFGHRLRARAAQRVGLGAPAPLGDRLGEVGEQHGEPQPHGESGP